MGKVEITAKRRTSCQCGQWVNPGDVITWDPQAKRTTGCAACLQTGQHPDPSANADRDDPWLELTNG